MKEEATEGMAERVRNFQDRIWGHYREYGRELPWRNDPTPYQVFVSEIMLQQTQVSRVLERYPRWLTTFPDFAALAAAGVGEVVSEWQGMGYNRRALWLRAAAQRVMEDYGGGLPADPAELVKLPGVGPNTAGSIAAFVYNAPTVFIETNVRRVFIHEFFVDHETVADAKLRPIIEVALDRDHPRQWYYALMDYGAYLAKRVPNPNRRSKHYSLQPKFEGSVRQLRGEILRRLLVGPLTLAELRAVVAEQNGPSIDASSGVSGSSLALARLPTVLAALEVEGFIEQANGCYRLK